MGKHQHPHQEGDANQRREAAREAKAEGKLPSEVGATQGASKQRKEAPNNATHQEKMELKHEGKTGPDRSFRSSKDGEQPRPGSRETDEGRDDREAPFQ